MRRYTICTGIIPVLLGALFVPEAHAALRFKTDWYFSQNEKTTSIAGINDSTIPYFEDHRLEQGSPEYSLADLQQRAEALNTWLGAVGSFSDRAPSTTTTEEQNLVATQVAPHLERASAPKPSPLQLPEAEASIPQETFQKVQDVCAGIYFQNSSALSLYEFETDQEYTAEVLSECIYLDSNTHNFVVMGEKLGRPIAIQTYGLIETNAPVPSYLVNKLSSAVFNVGFWIPEWSSESEDIEISVDETLVPDENIVVQTSESGTHVLFNYEYQGVKEIRLYNHWRDEGISFLLNIDHALPRLAVLGINTHAPSEELVYQVTPNDDPTKFLEYYGEDQSMFIEAVEGVVSLTNRVMPHIFRYYDGSAQSERTFIWEQGEYAQNESSLNLQEVLTSVRSKKREMGLDLDSTGQSSDILVARSDSALAPPALHRVAFNGQGEAQWDLIVNTFRFEEDGVTTQVFIDPPEGEYWLDDGSENSQTQKVWVLDGIDTLIH